MNIDSLDIDGCHCHLFQQDSPQGLLVQPLGEHEQDTLPDEIATIVNQTTIPFAMAAFVIEDWERELMPWGHQKTRTAATLQFLLEKLLPPLTRRLGNLPVMVGGYSLAGLFALWAARNTCAFTGVAAASPSVWIPDWSEYAQTHPMQANHVYLSLGVREEHTRNRSFALVGDRIRQEHSRLQQQLGDRNCTLEWNPGGHFTDCTSRLARAFVWNLNRLTDTTTSQA